MKTWYKKRLLKDSTEMKTMTMKKMKKWKKQFKKAWICVKFLIKWS